MKHPHRDLKRQRGRNAWATVGWLHRFLERVLGRKKLSAEGLRIERTAQGLTCEEKVGHASPPVALWHVPKPDGPLDAYASPGYVDRQLARALSAEITGTAEMHIHHVGRNAVAIGKRSQEPLPFWVTTQGGEVGVYYGEIDIAISRGPTGDRLWVPTLSSGTMKPGQYSHLRTRAGIKQSIVIEIEYQIEVIPAEIIPGTSEVIRGKVTTKVLQPPRIVALPYGSEQSTSSISRLLISGTHRYRLAVVDEAGVVRNLHHGPPPLQPDVVK